MTPTNHNQSPFDSMFEAQAETDRSRFLSRCQVLSLSSEAKLFLLSDLCWPLVKDAAWTQAVDEAAAANQPRSIHDLPKRDRDMLIDAGYPV